MGVVLVQCDAGACDIAVWITVHLRTSMDSVPSETTPQCKWTQRHGLKPKLVCVLHDCIQYRFTDAADRLFILAKQRLFVTSTFPATDGHITESGDHLHLAHPNGWLVFSPLGSGAAAPQPNSAAPAGSSNPSAGHNRSGPGSHGAGAGTAASASPTLPPNLQVIDLKPTLEENPKWQQLRNILDNIAETAAAASASGATATSKSGVRGVGVLQPACRVLVVVKDTRTAAQVTEYLSEGGDNIMMEHFQRFLARHVSISRRLRPVALSVPGITHRVAYFSMSSLALLEGELLSVEAERAYCREQLCIAATGSVRMTSQLRGSGSSGSGKTGATTTGIAAPEDGTPVLEQLSGAAEGGQTVEGSGSGSGISLSAAVLSQSQGLEETVRGLLQQVIGTKAMRQADLKAKRGTARASAAAASSSTSTSAATPSASPASSSTTVAVSASGVTGSTDGPCMDTMVCPLSQLSDRQSMLNDWRPTHVVMYDADVAFTRAVEVRSNSSSHHTDNSSPQTHLPLVSSLAFTIDTNTCPRSVVAH